MKKIIAIMTCVIMILTVFAILTPTQKVSGTIYTVDDDGGVGIFTTIQSAITAAGLGDTINVKAGTYAETLDIYKSLTIEGESRSGVTIDSSGFSDYAIDVQADDVTLGTFTLIGSNNYGIKVDDVTNALIEDITVQDSGRTGIDLNGVDNSVVTNIEVKDTVSGNGLAFTDCDDIAVSDVTTSGNAWGGIAVYTYGQYYAGGSDGLSFTGTMSLGESSNPFYTQIGNYYGGAPYPITNLIHPSHLFYIVKAPTFYPTHEFYRPSLSDAILTAAGSPDTSSVVIEISTGDYHVGPGIMIQSAIDDASNYDNINVHAGTYNENLIVDKRVSISADGASKEVKSVIVRPTGNKNKIGFDIRAHYVSISGFKIENSLHGFFTNNRDNLNIGHNHITGAKLENIRLLRTDNSDIHHNVLTNSIQRSGLYLENSNYNNIHHNTANDNPAQGIGFKSSSYNTIHHNTCNGNTVWNGISLYWNSNNNELHHNTAEGNFEDGFRIRASDNNNVHHNIATNNGLYGIHVFDRWLGGQYRTSDDNTIFKNSAHGHAVYDLYDDLSGTGNTWIGNDFGAGKSYPDPLP